MPSLVLSKLDLIRRALLVALEHAEIMRHGVELDDVDAITRGRWGLDNAIDLTQLLAQEVDAVLPDWRPAPHSATHAPDGYSGDNPGPVRHAQPDAHLGAVE